MEDIIDQGNSGEPGGVPQAVKTLGIVSIVGSGLWGLIILIAMFYILGASGAASSLVPGVGDMIAAVVIVCIIFVALNALGILGVMKMMKGNKGGFTLYAIVTGLWALLMLMVGIEGDVIAIISALASIGFIVAFGMQMKNM